MCLCAHYLTPLGYIGVTECLTAIEVDMTIKRNAEKATQIRTEDGTEVSIQREEVPIPIFRQLRTNPVR
jgi:hypothetical protein